MFFLISKLPSKAYTVMLPMLGIMPTDKEAVVSQYDMSISLFPS